ncbi:hepatic lectin-like isoform X1 [Danio rerio]|uniref:Hepatic lectin-like isoform X1 n=2 Tax=Danio rerio TaxID=7955 RepID=A0AC58GM64_DANRE
MSKTIYGNINAGTMRSAKIEPQHEIITQGSDSKKISNSKAVPVCLVLLCFLLLTAVIVLSIQVFTNVDPFQINSKNFMKEKYQLQTNITDLAEERDELLIKNWNLTKERDGLLTKNDNLTKQRDRFSDERKVLWKKLSETDGWLYSKYSLYFISSEKRSWADSRRYCTERGADLIIIGNREEQEFVNKISRNDEFWIGLTDSDEEGSWKWVDGTNMMSRFWNSREPSGQIWENCAINSSPGWSDYPCNHAFKWLCEKNIFK